MARPHYLVRWMMKPQSAAHKGTAKSHARAKLFPGRSLIFAKLSFVTRALPLSAKPRQRIAGPPHAPRARSGLLGGVAEAGQLAKLLFVLLLAGHERREAAANHVIYVMSTQARRRAPSLGTRLAVMLAMVLAPRVACAQTSRVATPTDMFDAENSPGLALGDTLVLRNETVARIQEDSNIYNVETNRTADTIGVINSDFRLGTNSRRHMAEINGGVGLLRYVDTTAEDTTTYYGGGRARLDLGSRITVDADGQLGRGYEMRGTAGDQFTTDHPVLYNRRQIHARLARTGGILELAVDGSIRTQDYLDAYTQGVRISLAYRNATVRQGALEAQYRLSPALRLYSQLSANDVAYGLNLGYPRDSNGYAALFGVHLAVTSLIDLEVAAGYMHQSFQTPGTAPVSGINYKLTANWTPTPMWRLTADGRRDIDASPLTNVPAIVRSTFDLKAQRALGERMILEGSAAYTQEEYRSLSRTDRRVEAGLGVHYRVTSNVGAIAQAGYRQQWGGALGRVYSGFSGSLGLRFVL